MNKKVAFLIIFALIALYGAIIGFTTIPYKGIIGFAIILSIAVVTVKAYKKK